MPRYLLKKRGRSLEYVSIPKGTRLERGNRGYRAVTKTRKGVWLKGFTLVTAKSKNAAYKRTFGFTVRRRR